MASASLVVELIAKTGSFSTDIQRSTKDAEKRLKEFQASAKEFGTIVGASLVAGAAAFAYFAKSINDGIDALNDVSDATGSSIENISALEDVAMRTGATLDDVSGALVKFNNVLKEADGKNGVSKALESIGLQASELRKLDPSQALLETARALAQFEDDGDKARLTAELFGKNVAKVAPLLKDLAESGDLNAKVTKAQAEEAERFNKSLFELQTNITQLARDITGPLVSALNKLIDRYKAGAAAGKSFWDTALEGYKQDVSNFYGGGGTTPEMRRSSGTVDYGPMGPPAPAGRPSVDFDPEAARAAEEARKKADADAKKRDASFKSYLDSLNKQLEKTKELSAAEQVLKDIEMGRIEGVNKARQEQLIGIAKQIDASNELERVEKEREKSQRALQDSQKEWAAQAAKIAEDVQGPFERYMAELERVNALLEYGIITQDVYTKKTKQLGDEYVKAGEQVKNAADEFSKFSERAQENIQDALGQTLEDALSGNFDNIGKMWNQLVTRMVAQALAAKLNEALFPKSGSGGAADWLSAAISGIGAYFGGTTGTTNTTTPTKLATGMDYVPYDNFPALLHKGERVMTAADNNAFSSGAGGGVQVSSVLNISGGGVSRTEFEKALDARDAKLKADLARTRRQEYTR